MATIHFDEVYPLPPLSPGDPPSYSWVRRDVYSWSAPLFLAKLVGDYYHLRPTGRRYSVGSASYETLWFVSIDP